MSSVINCINDRGKHTSNTINMVTVDKTQPFFQEDSFNEVVFQSDGEEDFSDGKRLTSLVRDSYLRRLREILKKNFQTWFEKNKDIISLETERNEGRLYLCTAADIEKCVKFLEQKALRSCMIASLYQKSMVNVINSVKQKTKENQLYDDLSNAENLYASTCTVCTQTDNISIDEECQTALPDSTYNPSKSIKNIRSTSSLLDLPLPDPKDVLLSLSSDFFDQSSLNLVKPTNHPRETIATVHPQPRGRPENKTYNNIRKDVSNISKNKVHDAPTNSEGFSRELKRRKLSNDLYVGNLINIVPDDSRQIMNDTELISMLTDDCKDETLNNIANDIYDNNKNKYNNCNIIDDFDLVNNLESCIYNDNISSTGTAKVDTHGNSRSNTENVTTSLDDRLAELGVLINDESNISSTNSKTSVPVQSSKCCPRRSWSLESAAHYCNFVKVFLSLDERAKRRARQRFKQLFGDDDEDDNIALTPELLAMCRKRTANIVVAELTPYFNAKKFGSRFLFKEFAKRVTNSILSRTYASDSSAVNQFVSEYFNEHIAVNTLEDIDF